MNEIRAFERRMGGRWTGVSFHRQIPRDTRKVDQSMPFCKAVTVSNTGALTLAREDINCPGAWRSFGWQSEVGSSFMDKIIRRTGFSQPVAEKLIRETPAIDDADIVGVTVGDYETPDILISYLQPAHAMRFLLLWQAVYQKHARCIHLLRYGGLWKRCRRCVFDPKGLLLFWLPRIPPAGRHREGSPGDWYTDRASEGIFLSAIHFLKNKRKELFSERFPVLQWRDNAGQRWVERKRFEIG